MQGHWRSAFAVAEDSVLGAPEVDSVVEDGSGAGRVVLFEPGEVVGGGDQAGEAVEMGDVAEQVRMVLG
jgi:hypothetical protein